MDLNLEDLVERLSELIDNRLSGSVSLPAVVRLGDDMRKSGEQLVGLGVYLMRKTFGASWEDIGHELGISRQSAWERYRDYESPPTDLSVPEADTIRFRFKVNGSFIDYMPHPITVPKAAHDRLLNALGTETLEVTVRGPDGPEMEGTLRHSTSGGGPYFQVMVREGMPGETICDFQIGQTLIVEITPGSETVVHLRPEE